MNTSSLKMSFKVKTRLKTMVKYTTVKMRNFICVILEHSCNI